jgi:small subunit ribosomal protein S16
MPVKIRLAKRGRKKLAFYHIVVTDSRAPRDGKSIERIGSYNPGTNPATIELNFDRALDWLLKGAQPTDTCRSILSGRGVLYKKHLLEGVKKGAFNEEEAESRFQRWINDKQSKVKTQADILAKGKADEAKKRLDAETKVKEAKAEILAKKLKAEEEARQEAKAEVAVKVVAEAEAEVKAEAKAESKPDMKAEARAEVEPSVVDEPGTEVEPSVVDETGTEVEPMAEDEAGTEKKARAEKKAEAEPETEVEAKAEAKAGETVKPKKKAKSHAEDKKAGETEKGDTAEKPAE